jgi:hypothetical protein
LPWKVGDSKKREGSPHLSQREKNLLFRERIY